MTPMPFTAPDLEDEDTYAFPEDLLEDKPAPAPLPADVDGASILDQVEKFLSRFVIYPSEHARTAHVLWIAHTWRMDLWDSTPRLAFMSAEPGSGKSRALEVTTELVPNPLHAIDVTPAYLLRKIGDEDGAPTVLYDEIDTVFGPKARDSSEDVRSLLNAGHRRGATAGRCIKMGSQIVPEEYAAYCAVALAGLKVDNLPDTIRTRAVVIRMRRRAASEKVTPWRQRDGEALAAPVRELLKSWTLSLPTSITDWPTPPEGVEDRNADVWESLLWLANRAGGSWPRRAAEAAVYFVREAKETPATLGVLLLHDLRKVFDAHPDAAHLATADIVRELHGLDESPWADEDRPLDGRRLSALLRDYEVRPRKIRTGATTARGYRREDLLDPWTRYLPPTQDLGSTEQAEHPELPQDSNGLFVPPAPNVPGTSREPSGSDPEHFADVSTSEPRHSNVVPGVPDVPVSRDYRGGEEA